MSITANRIGAANFFFNRLQGVPLKKAAIFAVDVVRHWRAVQALLRAPRGSNISALVAAYPETLFMVSGPYLANSWDGTQRIARLIDHCRTVEGGRLDLRPGVRLELFKLTFIDPRYRLIVHQPREYIWEGLLDLSLCYEDQVIFSLRFSLSSEHGKRTAYIGGLQGRHQKYESRIIEIYKDFSLKAERIRPRDFMIEAFQMLCGAIEMDEILAIADANKPWRGYQRSYDEDWRARGGVYNRNGFFNIPVKPMRRSEDEMTARKRTMYRRRYRMLDRVQSAMAEALQNRTRRSAQIPPIELAVAAQS
jgi:uncharacterized protein VirK/YbjX